MLRRGHRLVLIAAAVAALLFAYGNSFSVPLLLDDVVNIRDNRSIRDLSRLDAVLWPPPDSGNAGRPLLNLTFALNHAVSGVGVTDYHIVNVLIHVAAAATLFGIVRRTLQLPVCRDRYGRDAIPLAAAISGAWALHPLQINAVTYLSQRAESLMGLFYLFALYAFLRGATGGRARWWTALSIAACFAGVAVKEVMVSAPLVILLYDRAFLAGSFAAAWRQRGRVFLGLAASWLLLAGLMMQSDVGRRIGHGDFFTPLTYALSESRVVLGYLRLALWPHPLIFDYDADYSSIRFGQMLPACSLVIALLALVAVGFKRSPKLAFLGGWFFAILAPTSSFVPIEFQPMAESRMFLPLAGVVALGVIGAYAGLASRAWLPATLATLALAVLTRARHDIFRDELTLWQDTVAKRPQAIRAQNAYALALAQTPDRSAEAIARFKALLTMRPSYAEAHHNLSIQLARRPGGEAEALDHAREAVRLDPKSAAAHDNLGNLLARQLGELSRAIQEHELAIRLRPDFAEAHSNLATALARMPDRKSEAAPHYRIALELDPNLMEAHYNLANLLAESKDQDSESILHYEAALRLRPDLPEAHNNLAVVLARSQTRLPEAIGHYRQAIASRPNYADARYNLALALAQNGQLNEAAEQLRAVIQLNPSHHDAREALQRLEAATR